MCRLPTTTACRATAWTLPMPQIADCSRHALHSKAYGVYICCAHQLSCNRADNYQMQHPTGWNSPLASMSPELQARHILQLKHPHRCCTHHILCAEHSLCVVHSFCLMPSRANSCGLLCTPISLEPHSCAPKMHVSNILLLTQNVVANLCA